MTNTRILLALCHPRLGDEYQLWGLISMYEILCMFYDYGVSLPQNEHVDIFPVRLCLHSTEYSPSTLL